MKLFDEPCIGDLLLSQKFLVFDSVFMEMSEAHNIFIMWNLDSMRMLSTKCEFALLKIHICELQIDATQLGVSRRILGERRWTF